jgi:hypothetical protein
MAIEIVDFPMKNGDFPLLCKRLPEGNCCFHEDEIYEISTTKAAFYISIQYNMIQHEFV